MRILSAIENDNPEAAASIATLLLLVSLATIVVLDLLQRRISDRG